jgi:hypothetical protein
MFNKQNARIGKISAVKMFVGPSEMKGFSKIGKVHQAMPAENLMK